MPTQKIVHTSERGTQECVRHALHESYRQFFLTCAAVVHSVFRKSVIQCFPAVLFSKAQRLL
jgi:hypothetical protein